MTGTQGKVRIGEWAHFKYMDRQHFIVGIDPRSQATPVILQCGKRSETFRVWHDAPRPHLPKCRRCEEHA